MNKLLISVLGLALFCGCVVYRVEPYRTPTHTVQTTGTVIVHSDIEWVVWEYYDWDYDTVVHLHSLNYTPDEVSLILFLSYHSHIHPTTIVKWRSTGSSWFEITTVHLRLEPTIFFVDIPHNTRLAPPYGNAYGYYWANPRHIVLNDYEMVKLVHLKVFSEAYRMPPVEVIRLYEKDNDYSRIVEKKHNDGKEIRTRKGRTIREIPPKVNKPDNKKREQPNKPNNPPNKPDKDKLKDNPEHPDKDNPKDTPKDQPKNDKPKDNPNTDKPGKDTPSKDTPKDKPKDNPDKDKPKEQPKEDKPKDNPNTDKPDKDNSDKGNQGKDKPKKGK